MLIYFNSIARDYSKSFIKTICVIVLLFSGITLHAQIHHIDPISGVNNITCGTAGSPCLTIQYAIENQANNGDTIYLYSGTYSLPSTVSIDSAIVEFPADVGLHFIGDTNGTGAIIDGNNERRGFHYDHGSNCPAASGLHNGVADSRHFSFHNIRIQNCAYPGAICGTVSQSRGAGIFILNDPSDSLFIQVTNCKFENNLAHDSTGANNHGRSAKGGAIYFHGRLGASTGPGIYAQVLVDSCRFVNNGAVQLPNGGWGGAISLSAVTNATITNSNFCSNYTFGIDSDNGDLEHDRNAGGAILFHDFNNSLPANQFEVNHCTFINNSATTVNGSTFLNQSGAGAVFLTRGDDLNATSNAVLTVGNSDFYGNLNETSFFQLGSNSGTIDTLSIGNNILSESYNASLGPDTSFCADDTIILNASTPLATYLWMDGSTDSIFLVTLATPDTIWVEIDLFGCMLTDTIIITNDGVSQSPLGNDTAVCEFDSILLDPNLNGFSVIWQDNSNTLTFSVDSIGTYWFQATHTNGCSISDTIHITKKAPIIDGLGEDTAICSNAQILLDPGFSNVTYTWQDGSTADTLMVDTTGLFWFTALDTSGCIISDTIRIISTDTFIQGLGEDTTICKNSQILLDPGFSNVTYTWQDGSTADTLVADSAGLFWFTALDTSGCIITDTQVVTISQTSINLGPDTTLCLISASDFVLDPQVGPGGYLWNNGSTNPTLAITEAGIYWLKFTDSIGCSSSDTIMLNMSAEPEVYFGAVPTICEGEEFILKPINVVAESLSWSDGTIADSIVITQSGLYSVSAINDCGSSTAEITVAMILCACKLFIPNVLTPNQDGMNDDIHPTINCDLQSFDFIIYNRWGTSVFRSNSLQIGWDGYSNGEVMSEGTYYYIIRYQLTDEERERKISGSFSLIH